MWKLLRLAVIIMCIVVGATGCINHQVLPAPQQTVDPEVLPYLEIPHSVAIIGEPVEMAEEMLVCQGGAHRYYATSENLTDAAVAVLQDIFTKNDIKMEANGDKKITLSVIETTCEMGWVTLDYITRLTVVTGDNIRKEYRGNQSIGHIFGTTWAVEKAVANAVLEMLKDPEIIAYLQRT